MANMSIERSPIMSGLSLYEVFRNNVVKNPNKTALIFLGKRFSYFHLAQIIDQVAGSLNHYGIIKGDRVMIYLPHTPQWVIIWIALQRIGAVAIPFTTFYGPQEIKYIANDTGSRMLFCIDTNVNFAIRALSETPLEKIVVCNMMDLMPYWKTFLGKVYHKIPEGKFIKDDNVIPFKDLLKDKATTLPPIDVDDKDFAEILYTGGTTGEPKGVPITHIALKEAFIEMRQMWEGVIPLEEDIVIQGAPLFHILGQTAGFASLFNGDTLVLLPRYNIDAVLDHIQTYKIKTIFGTPTAYRMILDHPRFEFYNLKSLKYCGCGGDALPDDTARRWRKKVGVPISLGYGITEAAGAVSMAPPDKPHPAGTCGKALPSKRLRLIDPEMIDLSPVRNQGELLVSSENMITSYWNKPEETAERFIKLDEKLWYKTGDIIHIDEDGWLFFVDRNVDLIKHKGYRVSASRVEKMLQEHHAVLNCCVVGVPDEKVGERIKAFVTVKTDIKGVGADELIQFCRKNLAPYEVPQYIEFRDVLPKSKVGKLLKRELRDDERRKMES
jgi:long-chain acyl-CoA synthetase